MKKNYIESSREDIFKMVEEVEKLQKQLSDLTDQFLQIAVAIPGYTVGGMTIMHASGQCAFSQAISSIVETHVAQGITASDIAEIEDLRGKISKLTRDIRDERNASMPITKLDCFIMGQGEGYSLIVERARLLAKIFAEFRRDAVLVDEALNAGILSDDPFMFSARLKMSKNWYTALGRGLTKYVDTIEG